MTGPTRRKVAAFDFDGTLTRHDTLMPFMARAGGRLKLAKAVARVGSRGLGRKVDLRDRDAVKAEILGDLFAGREVDELRYRGELFAADILGSRVNPSVLHRLRSHVEAGHEVVFVSASLVYYLEPVAKELGVCHVIGVEPEVQAGKLTGRLSHPNVRAEQKALRLREWLDQPAVGPLDSVELWAYGNSSGDLQLLELADHAFWLGKPSRLPAGSTPLGVTALGDEIT